MQLSADDGIVKGQEVWQMVHKQDTFETIAALFRIITPVISLQNILSPTNISDEIQEWLNEERKFCRSKNSSGEI